MPTLASIHAFIGRCCPQIHAARRRVLFAAVSAALRGGALSLTNLGRALAGEEGMGTEPGFWTLHTIA